MRTTRTTMMMMRMMTMRCAGQPQLQASCSKQLHASPACLECFSAAQAFAHAVVYYEMGHRSGPHTSYIYCCGGCRR